MNSCSVLISLSCIVYNSYSPRTEFVGLKKFILNLKFCGLQVHDLSLSCWGIWYDGLELLQTCSEQNFMSGIFIFKTTKWKVPRWWKTPTRAICMKSTNKQPIHMLLASFWALPNFVTFLSFFSYSHDRESCTHHPYMLKLPHRNGSISRSSTHSYPFLCSKLYEVSPKVFLQ